MFFAPEKLVKRSHHQWCSPEYRPEKYVFLKNTPTLKRVFLIARNEYAERNGQF
jgi:hypothetical protein